MQPKRQSNWRLPDGRDSSCSTSMGHDDHHATACLDLGLAPRDGIVKKVYACPHCLKEFPSGKALCGHMKCHPAQPKKQPNVAARTSNSLEESDSDSIEATYVAAAQTAAGNKRPKRSSRSHGGAEIKDERDMANCLIMLACDTIRWTPSCASAADSVDDDEPGGEEVDWLKRRDNRVVAKYLCATCKRAFKSHQALGGHRASHKKVKGCFARTSSSSSSKATLTTVEDEEEEELPPSLPLPPPPPPPPPSSSRSAGGHECSVCHRVFATGQALGGHKRCHWVGSGVVPPSKHKFLNLDLNLPPDEQDLFKVGSQETSASCDTASSFHSQQTKQQWGASMNSIRNFR